MFALECWQLEMAEPCLLRAMELAGQVRGGELTFKAHYNLGLLLMETGRPQEAVPQLQLALAACEGLQVLAFDHLLSRLPAPACLLTPACRATNEGLTGFACLCVHPGSFASASIYTMWPCVRRLCVCRMLYMSVLMSVYAMFRCVP